MRVTLQPEPTVAYLIEAQVGEEQDYIADQVLPAVPVVNLTGYFGRLLQGAGRIVATVVKGLARNVVNFEFDRNATYAIEDNALETPIDRNEAERCGGWNEAKEIHGVVLVDLIRKNREHMLASALVDTSIITNYVTLTGGDQWTTSTSEVLGRIKTAKESVSSKTGKPANRVFMGYPTYLALQSHPQIIATLAPGRPSTSLLSADDMAKAFGIEKVIVGMATYDEAMEGQTEDQAFIWGDNLIVAYVAPSGQARFSKTLGANLKCPTKAPDTYAGSYVPEGKNADQVQVMVVGRNWQDKLINTGAAYAIRDTNA
jgi:hypothetical protein